MQPGNPNADNANNKPGSGVPEPKAYISAQKVERAAIEATEAWLIARQQHHEPLDNEEEEQNSLLRFCAVYLNPTNKRETGISDIITEPASPKT